MLFRRWIFAVASILGILIFPFRASAARTMVPAGSPFVVDVWGIEEGLPQSSVLSVAQTQDGYLWIGTLNGLVRFDGLKFTLFDESNTPGLNSSRVLNLFEDSRRRLWFGMENGSVAMVETNGTVRTFNLGQGSSGGRFIMTEDGHGIVWLMTATGFLGHYREAKLNITFAGCKALAAEADVVWLGLEDKLVAIQSVSASASALIVANEIPLSGRLDLLVKSRRGGYWRLDGRIQKWNGTQRERDLGSYPWGNTPVIAACEDADGNLIVGTYGDGVYWFQPDRKFIHIIGELLHASVLSVTVDREGNLWVGTNGGGLHRIRRRAFSTFPDSEGLVVQSVSADAQGGLWIGYNGESRVDHFSNGTNRTLRIMEDFRLRSICDVKSVFVDRSSRVFAGIRFNGDPRQMPVRVFEFRTNRFQAFSGIPPANENVSVLFQDRLGALWVGQRNGLVRSAPDRVDVFNEAAGLAGDDIRAVCEDRDGDIWVATGSGLSRIEPNGIRSFRKSDGLPSDDLSCLYLDSKGELWVGTRGSGLARFWKNRWIHYTIATGLSGNSIGYMIEDAEANLWIGSNAGLMRIARSSLDEFAEGKVSRVVCRTYVESDGLPTRECTEGSQPAAARTADGQLWFPTAKGLVSVMPRTLRSNPFQPPVVLESILVGGVQQITNRLRPEPPEILVIPPGKESLEIQFTSLNLGAADQSRFRYRLEGHEEDWIYVGNTRSVRYTKLAPRDYRFLVTAANEDGVWNPVPAVQLIRVEPPFWRTSWFIVTASLITLGLIVGTVHFLSTQRLQRELAELKRQEELEKERARIARDLHDQLGANLTQVSLLGEMAEADRELPAEVLEHARQITDTARETTKALDEIVWAVNPQNDTLEGLVNYLCKYSQEYFELADLRYRIEVPPELPKLALEPDVRHNVFLAAKEAINNVVKHAEASAAWLRLKLDSGQFTIEIEDDGKGPAGMSRRREETACGTCGSGLRISAAAFQLRPPVKKGRAFN